MHEDNSLFSFNDVDHPEELVNILKEHPNLTPYAVKLANECMDLNAKLFEQANIKIQAAKKIQSEREEENLVLKSEVGALKDYITKHIEVCKSYNASLDKSALHRRSQSVASSKTKSPQFTLDFVANLANPIPNRPLLGRSIGASLENVGGVTSSPAKEKLSRLLSKHAGSNSITCLHTSMTGSVSQNVEKVTGRRKDLFTSLLGDASYLEDDQLNKEAFKDFLDWIDGGCEISNLIGFLIPKAKNKTQIEFSQKFEIASQSSIASSVESDIDSPVEAYPSQDMGYIREPSSSVYNLINAGDQFNENAATDSFTLRLAKEDILPALEFPNLTNTQRCELFEAILHGGIEILPPDSAKQEANIPCVYMPLQNSSFKLKLPNIQLPKQTDRTEKVDKEITYSICKLSRDRIASVINLIEYLRHLRSIFGYTDLVPETGSNLSVDSSFVVNRESNPGSNEEENRRIRYFHKVQKHRVAISLARLGFGLPEYE